ncbi:MAG: hypothetical protein IPL43_07520 [Micropruina sp.]|nr:hypothetical protein [Micropruina sp.]
MKSFRALCAVSATSIVLFGAASLAQASTWYSSYNTTIGKYGSAAYSGTQIKDATDRDAEVASGTVGGNYVANVCLVPTNSGWCVSETKEIDDGTRRLLRNVVHSDNVVRLKFTDGFAFVNVQVSGKWRADKG